MLSWLLTRRGFLIGGSLALADVLYGMQDGKTPEAPKSAGSASPELLQDLVAANRILAGQGVVDRYGHVSVRHNLNSSRYLLSRSLAPELVTVDDIMEYDLDSVPVDPRGRAQYLERFIHGEIYRMREDVKAIVHNHSPSIISFGVSAVPLRPMYHMSAFIGEGVPVFDMRDFAGMSDMLVRNPALGHALATIPGNKPAALMRGHGAVVVGASLPIVVGRSVYLEINAKLQSQAVALGSPIKYLSPEEAQKATPPDNYQRAWELWKRKISAR
ncbi:MAG TPA: class II aldolase/adducin family protein [Candidatus Angelobacter sp.]